MLLTLAVFALAVAGIDPLYPASPAVGQALDRDAFLSAVAEVETGGNARAIGRRGERGLYQFTRATWQIHSSRPFSDAHNPAIAYIVAVKHFDWLHERIVNEGREPTSYRLAVAWNAGLGRALSGSPPRSTRDYARRVSNLAGVVRTPSRPTASSQGTQVAASFPAPVGTPVTQISFTTAHAAPEVTPIRFSLGGSGSIALNAPAADVAEPVEEISFTLAGPAEPTSVPARRFIFATIGE